MAEFRKWRGPQVIAQVRKRVEINITLAALAVERRAVKLVSRGQPVKRGGGAGQKLVGLDPSKPPEPPKVLHGDLKQSITHEVKLRATEIVGRVGTNDVKARRLELGFVGSDALGRVYNEEPRPFLRRALDESKADIKRIVRKKR